jgi:hypothetical protein
MSRRVRALFMAGAFLLAALGWLIAGWLVQLLGLGELELPARAGGVFLVLSLGEAAFSRFFVHE